MFRPAVAAAAANLAVDKHHGGVGNFSTTQVGTLRVFRVRIQGTFHTGYEPVIQVISEPNQYMFNRLQGQHPYVIPYIQAQRICKLNIDYAFGIA